MNESIDKLEIKYSSNQKLIIENANKASLLLQEADKLKKENEHIAFCLSLLKKQIVPVIQSDQDKNSSKKKSLRAIVLDIIQDNESITIHDAWVRVKEQGIETTKATINATLFNLVKHGDLEKPAIGLYKKTIKPL